MNNHEQFQQMGIGSGLTRYRSAPSSYFASFTSSNGGFGADDFAELFNPRASSPETQLIFSRFMNGAGPIQQTCPSNMAPPPPPQLQRQRSHDYSCSSQMMYANHSSEAAPDSDAVDGAFASFNSNCTAATQPKMDRPAPLIRHSSSPAGLFANINIENEASFSSSSKLMSRIDYSSRHTSSGMMDPIQEIGSKDMEENAGDDEDHGNDVDYITGLPAKSWDDSALMSDHYLNGVADHDNKSFYNADASDDQKNEAADRPKTLLSHHLSLPKSSELSAMEKLLQDSVPFKIRAKRGCATHPRSIAERVRRTKISERMRKLQEVVPNMEKQTNTSDMLDLAVDYIKELQRQVKMLSDNQANCNCSAKRRR